MNARQMFWVGILLGAGMGGLGAAAITLHITANQVDAGSAQVEKALENARRQYEANIDLATQEIVMWQKRAAACEAKLPAGQREPVQIPLEHFHVEAR